MKIINISISPYETKQVAYTDDAVFIIDNDPNGFKSIKLDYVEALILHVFLAYLVKEKIGGIH